MSAPLEALALARHPLPEWAAFQELRAAAGHGRDGSDQRFDVVAFNVYPSKRQYRVAYEMKRSRSDFLAELAQPAKRGQAEDFFHETWFVVERGVCKPEEVPDGWGLLVATQKGDALRVVKRARPREPQPVPYDMLMSVLRAATVRLAQQPHFELEGVEVTAADIERLVLERTKPVFDAQTKEAERQRDLASELYALRQSLSQPLQHLVRQANGDRRWRDRQVEAEAIVTEAGVDRLIARAASRRLADLAEQIDTVRGELVGLATAIREA
jgi:hypothetical protein